MKAMGARLHPMSGAGSIKGDGSDDEHHYEVKDANKSYTLSGEYIRTHYREAIAEAKEAIMLVHFANGMTAYITIVPTESITKYRQGDTQ